MPTLKRTIQRSMEVKWKLLTIALFSSSLFDVAFNCDRQVAAFAVSHVQNPHGNRLAAGSRQDSSRDDYLAGEENEGVHSEDRRGRSFWEKEVDYKRMAQEEVLEWEPCSTEKDGTAWVLLPPLSVQRPTAVVHFCGGTWLGSAPHIWYGRFLRDLVKHTSCVVIATTIPVTIFQTLDHVRLAKKVSRQFETAYEEIVLDEYGVLHNQTPTVAIGHSLGARLLVVKSTLGERVGSPRLPPPYRSAVLLSFTNHAAAAGIPGLAQLYQSAQTLQDPRREPTGRRKRRRRDREDDLGALWNQVSESLQAGTHQLRSALTPPPDALEFYPSPDDLWDAVSSEKGSRYNIPQTLLVQFDNDPVDQSSRLATAIAGNVRFCRLRGTHLTPVGLAAGGDDGESDDEETSRDEPLGRLLARATMDRNPESMRALRQSVVRYIMDVATKE